jgi:hypothetical protein
MLGKLNVLSLLARANKADATADKALGVAKKARSDAARQRVLVDRVLVEQNAVRLEREATAAALVSSQASQDFQLAQQLQNDADSALKAADRNVELAWQHLDKCKTKSKDAVRVAKVVRDHVPETKNENV